MKSTLFLALTGVLALARILGRGRRAGGSGSPGIAFDPGDTLDSVKPLVLKQGQHVTLISDTGSTLKLDGPYDRPPAAGGGGGVRPEPDAECSDHPAPGPRRRIRYHPWHGVGHAAQPLGVGRHP